MCVIAVVALVHVMPTKCFFILIVNAFLLHYKIKEGKSNF